MTMKLPVILSAMIAALAVSATLAEPDKAHSHHKHKEPHDGSNNIPKSPPPEYRGEFNEAFKAKDGDSERDLSPTTELTVEPGQPANKNLNK